MQIVSSGDNLHEMAKPLSESQGFDISCKLSPKKTARYFKAYSRKNKNISNAEFSTQHAKR